MKRATMILGAAAMTALALPAFAQTSQEAKATQPSAVVNYNTDRISTIETNYVHCLEYSNDAVVESAIAQAVRMRWAFPTAELEAMKEKVTSLALHGSTLGIRYRASLASMVFDAPSIFSEESAKNYVEDEDLFAAVTAQAQKTLIGFDAGQR